MSDHTAVLPEPAPQPAPRRSFGLVAVIASVVAVVLIAGGGFAAWRFLSGGGPRPADVLPASTFGLVTVDLDPSGGQKVEAIRALRKFPTFREESGLKPDSDPIQRIFEEIQEAGACEDLDYEKDVKPWLGQRAGLGGVLLEDTPTPVLAVQVSDQDKAESGFARVAECADLEGDGAGWTLAEDYVVISDSEEHAEQVVAAGKKSPLADSDTFERWTDEAGGAGIMNLYVAPEAVDIASEELGSGLEELGELGDALGGDSGELPGAGAGQDELADALAAYKDFEGAAAVLRFADGGVELSMAGGGGKAARGGESVGSHVAAMPGDTAVLLALAVPPGAFEAIEKADEGGLGSDMLGSMLGIDFPADLETLLGESLSLSLGGDAPESLESIQGPGDLSLGALISGDTGAIEEVIAKLEQSAGGSLEELELTESAKDGKVAIASTSDYADQLLGEGDLADDDGFKDVVPNAEDAQMIAYVDFGGGWGKRVLELIRDSGGEEAAEVADNLEALRGFGASAWTEDGVSHGLIRLGLK